MSQNVYTTLGASNHSDKEREQNDYYATEPKASELLMENVDFSGPILEPCCGEGHISEVVSGYGYEVQSSDLIDRGYGEVADFFNIEEWAGDIITNPPYKDAINYVRHALDIIPDGNKVAMFLKLQFLEGKQRGEFYKDNPPRYVYVSRSRLNCAMNGDFETYKANSAIAYAWFIWKKGYKGEPAIRWIN